MPDRKKALIAGATGVVGRNLLRHLVTLDDWDVVAVCRRKPDVEGRYEHVALDLLDRAQTFEALKRPRGVTHVFFSAYIERSTWAEMVAPIGAALYSRVAVVDQSGKAPINGGGARSPRDLAVLRLIMRSNLVDCTIGRT